MNYEEMWKKLKQENVEEFNDLMTESSQKALAQMASIEAENTNETVRIPISEETFRQIVEGRPIDESLKHLWQRLGHGDL